MKRVTFTPRAAALAEELDRQWRSHHPVNADQFADELGRAVSMLESFPRIGRQVEGGMRRLLLRKTGYHLYCVVHQLSSAVKVVDIRLASGQRIPFL